MVGTLVRQCRCALSWCDLGLTFDLAIVTLTYKMLSGLFHGFHKVKKFDTCQGDWLGAVCKYMCASWCDDFALLKCVQLLYLRHISLMTRIYGLLQLIIICTCIFIILFPLTTILQLLNFTASYFLVY